VTAAGTADCYRALLAGEPLPEGPHEDVAPGAAMHRDAAEEVG
jgi:hypothetical protein